MAHDQHADHATHAPGSDRSAAFVGLIVGAIVLFGIMRGIVYLTNAKYVGEKHAVEAPK